MPSPSPRSDMTVEGCTWRLLLASIIHLSEGREGREEEGRQKKALDSGRKERTRRRRGNVEGAFSVRKALRDTHPDDTWLSFKRNSDLCSYDIRTSQQNKSVTPLTRECQVSTVYCLGCVKPPSGSPCPHFFLVHTHPVWFNWDTVNFLISMSQFFHIQTDRHTDKRTYYMSP